MGTPHATPTELAAFLAEGTVVEDPERLLARASIEVDGAVRARFEVDPDTGLARDPEIAKALSDATCAQVEQWVEVGEENAIDGLAGTPRALGAGYRAPQVAPRALRILANAGLLNLPTTQLHRGVVA